MLMQLILPKYRTGFCHYAQAVMQAFAMYPPLYPSWKFLVFMALLFSAFFFLFTKISITSERYSFVVSYLKMNPHLQKAILSLIDSPKHDFCGLEEMSNFECFMYLANAVYFKPQVCINYHHTFFCCCSCRLSMWWDPLEYELLRPC